MMREITMKVNGNAVDEPKNLISSSQKGKHTHPDWQKNKQLTLMALRHLVTCSSDHLSTELKKNLHNVKAKSISFTSGFHPLVLYSAIKNKYETVKYLVQTIHNRFNWRRCTRRIVSWYMEVAVIRLLSVCKQ
jgi:hypothetical protein